jgi:cytochrome c556
MSWLRRVAMPCWFGVLSLALAACNEDGPVIPAATTKHVMVTITDPSSKIVFEAAAEPPEDDAGWQHVQAGAQTTADSARRLIRAVRGGNKITWVKQADALIDAADKAALAAAAKDAKALEAASDALYGTCESCHKLFQPQQAKAH